MCFDSAQQKNLMIFCRVGLYENPNLKKKCSTCLVSHVVFSQVHQLLQISSPTFRSELTLYCVLSALHNPNDFAQKMENPARNYDEMLGNIRVNREKRSAQN